MSLILKILTGFILLGLTSGFAVNEQKHVKTIAFIHNNPEHLEGPVMPEQVEKLPGKREILDKINTLSRKFSTGLPETRRGLAFFKGKARCITCHNSLDVPKTSLYLTKLMEFNRSGSHIKMMIDPSEKQKGTESKKMVQTEIRSLKDYISEKPDFYWLKLKDIPEA